MRVVVENAINAMKRWKIISGRFRHYECKGEDILGEDELLTKIVRMVAMFAKIHISANPLRSNNWVHPIRRLMAE